MQRIESAIPDRSTVAKMRRGDASPSHADFTNEVNGLTTALENGGTAESISAIRLPRFLRWLGAISSRLIGTSSAVDAAGYAPALKSIMRRRKHNMRRPRRIFAPIHASVQSSGSCVIARLHRQSDHGPRLIPATVEEDFTGFCRWKISLAKNQIRTDHAGGRGTWPRAGRLYS